MHGIAVPVIIYVYINHINNEIENSRAQKRHNKKCG